MLFGKFYTDEQIIEQLKAGGKGREQVLHYLFTESGWRNAALRLIRSLGGTSHEAEDAIQEAFIVLDSHVRSGRYQQIGELRSYFLGICRGRWYSNRRSVHRLIFSDDPPPLQRTYSEEPESLLLKSEEREHLKIALDQMDERCRELLSMYKLNYSMEEIAQAFNLGTENNARQRVFQCRQKLAKLLAQNPFFNEREL